VVVTGSGTDAADDAAIVPGSRPRVSPRLAVLCAIASGAVLASQQRVNGELRLRLHDILVASLVSMCLSLALTSTVLLVRPAARRAVVTLRQVPLWRWTGGLGGACMVVVAADAAPRLGIALLTVGLVAGQTSGALAVDRIGLGPSGRHPLTAPRLLGALLCLVAVGIGLLGSGARQADPWLLVVVVVTGAICAAQQALNGRVAQETGSASVATTLNFGTGAAAVVVVLLLSSLRSGWPQPDWSNARDWVLYLGGPLGASVVGVAAVVVRSLGVLRLGLAVIGGQLLGSLLLDVVAPVRGTVVDLPTVIGALLTLFAVAVASTGRARRGVHRPTSTDKGPVTATHRRATRR
jgi:transporter family-2 protein